MTFQLKVDCVMPAFAKHFDDTRPAVGTVCSTASEGDSLPAAMETTGQSDEIEIEGHKHTIQLLEKGGVSARLPAVFETDDTTTESLSTVPDVKREGRNRLWPN